MPEVIQTGRRGGKTTAMVERLKADPGAVLVVATADERRRLVIEYDLKPEQVITPQSTEKLRGSARMPRVYVDNAEWVLSVLLGHAKVEGMSVGDE